MSSDGVDETTSPVELEEEAEPTPVASTSKEAREKKTGGVVGVDFQEQRHKVTIDFRASILHRLDECSAKNRQFEAVFKAYESITEELIKARKQPRQRMGSATDGGGSEVTNAQIEALRAELSDVYKKKSVNDQTLLDRTKTLEEMKVLLTTVTNDRNVLQAEKDKFLKRIAELEVSLQKTNEEKTAVHDEWLALKASTNLLQEKVVDMEKDRVQLITRIRDLQLKQAASLNDEVDRHAELQRKRIQEDIAAALASADLRDDSGENDLGGGGFQSIGEVIPTKLRQKFEGNDGEITDVVWLNDEMSATAGSDKKVTLWTVLHGSVVRHGQLVGSNNTVSRLDVNPEDRQVILGSSNDHTVRGWNVGNQRLLFTLSGHGDKVAVARFLSSQQAVSGSSDRMIKLWDLRNLRCIKSFFPGSTVLDLVVRPGTSFISGHFDKKLRIWDGRTAEPAHVVEMGGKVTGLYRTQDDQQLLCSTRDDTLSLLDIRTLQTMHIYSAEQFRTSADTARCVVSPSMKYCAAGGADGSIFIWNVKTTKLEKVLHNKGHESAVMSLAWAPNGMGLLSVDRHKTVCYWQ